MGRHALLAGEQQTDAAATFEDRSTPDIATPRRTVGRRAAIATEQGQQHRHPEQHRHPQQDHAALAARAHPARLGVNRRSAARPVTRVVVASSTAAGTAVLTRTTTGPAAGQRNATPALPGGSDRAVHVRRTARAQRMALLVAPVLALTSCLSFALPANAATAAATTSSSASTGTVGSSAARVQHLSMSHDIQLPTIDNGSITIASYPAVVVSGGATVAQAQAAISAAFSAGGARATVLQTALSYLGTPYVEGGASHSAIDCSGLTMEAYASVGIPLAHYVPTQDAVATTISAAEAQPGDLVVYDSQEHVGIFLGDGLVLQAPHAGATVDIVPMYSAAHHFARLLPTS